MSKFSDGYDKINWSKPIPKKAPNNDQLPKEKAFMLAPKFDAFISPIDQTRISCPGGLREHNKKHGVTNVRDYGENYFERRGKEKYAEQQGATKEQRAERKELINQAMRKRGL